MRVLWRWKLPMRPANPWRAPQLASTCRRRARRNFRERTPHRRGSHRRPRARQPHTLQLNARRTVRDSHRGLERAGPRGHHLISNTSPSRRTELLGQRAEERFHPARSAKVGGAGAIAGAPRFWLPANRRFPGSRARIGRPRPPGEHRHREPSITVGSHEGGCCFWPSRLPLRVGQFELYLVNGISNNRAADLRFLATWNGRVALRALPHPQRFHSSSHAGPVDGKRHRVLPRSANQPAIPASLAPQQSVDFSVVFQSAARAIQRALDSVAISVILTASVRWN